MLFVQSIKHRHFHSDWVRLSLNIVHQVVGGGWAVPRSKPHSNCKQSEKHHRSADRKHDQTWAAQPRLLWILQRAYLGIRSKITFTRWSALQRQATSQQNTQASHRDWADDKACQPAMVRTSVILDVSRCKNAIDLICVAYSEMPGRAAQVLVRDRYIQTHGFSVPQ